MLPDSFPGPPGDAEEPDGSPLTPAAEEVGLEDGGTEDNWPEDDWESLPEQGLYMCLPPEQLTLAGFAQNGEADTMAPGPLLGTVVHAVTGEDGRGLAGCSDDQLVGIISAARRLEARSAWTQMAAMREFASRRRAVRGPGGSQAEFAADELAGELHLTPLSAAGQIDFATTVAARLPETFAALGAGRIHPVHLRIIEDETHFLTEQDAAKADAILAEQAPGMTFGEVRHAAHKLILRLDPDAARKRTDAARREAQVRRFREESGNAGMVARELPPDEVLASWQHVEQRALDLRAAGLPGTLQELRVRAYLDLLQERDSRDLAAGGVAAGGGETGTAGAAERPAPSDDRPDADPTGPDGEGRPGEDGPGGPGGGGGNGPGGAGGSGGPGGPGAGPRRGGDCGPSVAALVTITIPWATLQGRSELAGEVDGFGVLDGDEARELAAAAARHPKTRWCVTALNPDGTAAAHGCLPGRRGPPDLLTVLKTPLLPIARGPCEHGRSEVGYHPSRKLAHLIRARSARCTAPGCGRPAARCDLDHTHAWDEGGRTCECNLAPLCRHHHRCKQAEGWRLDQPEPGVLVWRTPSGRTYATGPAAYSV
jgi:hypothetical protein